MEHAKKLMLVEPKLYRPSMREKTLSRLDEDIEETLASDLSDSEKAAKYIAALHRYKHYGAPKEVEEKVDVESDVLDTVPLSQRHTAKRLLDHLKKDRNFKIGDRGEISYNQQKVPQSHLGDLLNDILRKKSGGERPVGWEEFANSLKGVDVPKELVENTDLWNYMHPVAKEVKKVKKFKHSTPRQVSPPPPLSTPRRSRIARKTRKPRWLDYEDEQ